MNNRLLNTFLVTPEIAHTLRASQKKFADSIMQLIDKSADTYDPNEAVLRLTALKPKYLAVICRRDEYSMIRQFCCEHPALQQRWAGRLKKYNYPWVAIERMDGTGTDLFSMMLGAWYYGCYLSWIKNTEQHSDSILFAAQFLELACECNLFDAWKDRLTYETARLSRMCSLVSEDKESGLTLSDFQEQVRRILNTANEMGNRFWGAGFFFAGLQLEKAARELAVTAMETLQLERIALIGHLPALEEDYPLCPRLMIGAVRCYLSAWIVSDVPISEQLVKFLSPDGFFPSGHIQDWAHLHRYMLAELQNRFRVPSAHLLVEAIQEQLIELFQGLTHKKPESGTP